MKQNNCKCAVCGIEFYRKPSQIKNGVNTYCSVKCRLIGVTKKVTKICPICKNGFEVQPCQTKRNSGKYCSRECFSNARTIKETRICGYCRKEFIVTTGEIKKGGCKYCSKACYIKTMKGSGNSNWKGGLTSKYISIRNSDKSIEWRNSIFKRDNYTCRKCGDNKGHNLQAHHIIPFSASEELRFDITNGITLCIVCHKKEHLRLSQSRTKQLDIFATQRGSIL